MVTSTVLKDNIELNKMKKERTMYACSTAYCHDNELDLYESIEELKEKRGMCWEECGIVELSVTLVKEVVEGTMYDAN